MAETTLRVGEQGRVVIPTELRKALGIQVGSELVARVEGSRLVLETRQAVLERLQQRFAGLPEGVSLVDELITERRAEAQRELCD